MKPQFHETPQFPALSMYFAVISLGCCCNYSILQMWGTNVPQDSVIFKSILLNQTMNHGCGFLSWCSQANKCSAWASRKNRLLWPLKCTSLDLHMKIFKSASQRLSTPWVATVETASRSYSFCYHI